MRDVKRRRSLEDRFEKFVADGFEQRILDFDERSARLYAEVMGRRKAIGQPLSVLDGQIASIARANDLAVATRSIRDFEECGLHLINPFDSTRSTEYLRLLFRTTAPWQESRLELMTQAWGIPNLN